jgi:hypothetical protein
VLDHPVVVTPVLNDFSPTVMPMVSVLPVSILHIAIPAVAVVVVMVTRTMTSNIQTAIVA